MFIQPQTVWENYMINFNIVDFTDLGNSITKFPYKITSRNSPTKFPYKISKILFLIKLRTIRAHS